MGDDSYGLQSRPTGARRRRTAWPGHSSRSPRRVHMVGTLFGNLMHMTRFRSLLAIVGVPLVAGFPLLARSQAPASPPPAAQNPSPMVEQSRAHERLVQKPIG